MRRGLYAIVDVDALARQNRAVVPFAERVLAAGPLAALQLRAKSCSTREAFSLARELSPRCERAGVPFFVNDRPDVALLAGARGVHVGVDDAPVAEVRRFAKSLLVGVSTHDEEQLAAALATDADYVAFGPVFGTRSKADPSPTTGVEALRAASQRCAEARRPLVAIGGVTLDNAAAVMKAGATAAAAIAALLVDDGEVTARARALHAALGGA